MLLLFVCAVVHETLYDVPNQGSFWPTPALDVTTSVWVGIGVRKLDGGCNWLFELTLVRIVGLNTPAAAATRVSLIWGSRRSTARSTLWSSAIFTASSTVRRSVAGVCACANAVEASPNASSATS